MIWPLRNPLNVNICNNNNNNNFIDLKSKHWTIIKRQNNVCKTKQKTLCYPTIDFTVFSCAIHTNDFNDKKIVEFIVWRIIKVKNILLRDKSWVNYADICTNWNPIIITIESC